MDLNKPYVSFCFTTYKRKDYLKSTLESVRAQTFSDFEAIISDNDPEQSGRSVVEGMNDSRFKYFPNDENFGMKKSFNKSLERSSGEYIVMIADDDPVYPDMLETLMRLKDQHPDFGMFLGACNWFCTHPEIAKLYKLKVGTNSMLADKEIDTVETYSASNFLINFFNFNIFPTYLWSTGMIKREILIEKGGVPDYNTAFLGDYAYLSVLASHSGCVVINRALGHQTIHTQNFGRAQNEQIKTAAVNFIDYVSAKINGVKDWPIIERHMRRFVALWVVSHLNFLHRYYKLYPPIEPVNLGAIENEIFKQDFMQPFKLKFLLKKHTPLLHDFMVLQKKKFKKVIN